MLGRFFTNFDMFGAAPTLRMRGESEALNLCGGIASLLILIVFVYVFIDKAYKIGTFQEIEAKTTYSRVERRTQTLNVPIFFALGFEFMDREMHEGLFEVEVVLVEAIEGMPENFIQVPMKTCTISNLQTVFTDEEAQDIFENYSLENKYCTENLNVEMIGKFNTNAPSMKGIAVIVKPCYASGTPTCRGEPAYNYFMGIYLQHVLFLKGQLYLLNTGFNPEEKNPVVHFLDSNILFPFSQEIGTEVIVELGTYEIKTDTGMTPFITEQTESGFFVADKIEANYILNLEPKNETNTTDVRGATFSGFIYLSNVHMEIVRQYGKYDDALAYVGGLFGLVIGFLAFFMMSFNEYRYELFVSEAFSFRNQNKIKEEHFHFFKYLKYVVYDWVKTLFCCELNWEDCRKIDTAREEANEQIDVQVLLRRISHLEEINKASMGEGEDLCIYLTEDQKVEEVRNRRKTMNYYDKIVQGKSPLTMQNIEDAEMIFSMGTDFNTSIRDSKSFLFVKPKQQDKLDQALFRAKDFLECEQINLDQEEVEMEQKLSKFFFALPRAKRQTIQERIPLKILKRLKAIHEEHAQEKEKNTTFQKFIELEEYRK